MERGAGGSTYCWVFKALNKTEKRSRATTLRWVTGAMLPFEGLTTDFFGDMTFHKPTVPHKS